MKLSLKLPLAFALALVLLFMGGVFGIRTLNHAVDTYRIDVLRHVEANKKAADIAGQFSVAIQEWKNVLLRGKNPKDLDLYWAAHQKEMAKVIEGVDALSREMDDSTSRDLTTRLSAAMGSTAKAYESAFMAFKESGFDATVGDKAARGKDRESAGLLITLRKHLSEEEALASESASALASRGSALAYGVMTLVTLIGFAGSPWTVATYMVNGEGSKDQHATREYAYRDPAGFQALIDAIVDVTIGYLIGQIDAGVGGELLHAERLVDPGAGDDALQHRSAQIMRRGIGESAVETAHGGPAGRDDHHIGHEIPSSRLAAEMPLCSNG